MSSLARAWVVRLEDCHTLLPNTLALLQDSNNMVNAPPSQPSLRRSSYGIHSMKPPSTITHTFTLNYSHTSNTRNYAPRYKFEFLLAYDKTLQMQIAAQKDRCLPTKPRRRKLKLDHWNLEHGATREEHESLLYACHRSRLLPLGFKIEVSVNVAGPVFNSTCSNKFSITDSKDCEVFEMQMVATQCPGGRGVFNTIWASPTVLSLDFFPWLSLLSYGWSTEIVT